MASSEIKTEEIEKAVSVIIKKTFEKLVDIYSSHKEHHNEEIKSDYKSRLIFPCYGKHRNNNVRVSEQELRFAFVESLYEYCSGNNHLELFYSIETPTKYKYSFKDKNNPHKCEEIDDDYGSAQSASFDLVLYDNKMTRLAYIEFKANNAAKEEHLKDLCKLFGDPEPNDNSICYFIEIVKSHDENTINSLMGKLASPNNANKEVKCIVFDISTNDIIIGKEIVNQLK